MAKKKNRLDSKPPAVIQQESVKRRLPKKTVMILIAGLLAISILVALFAIVRNDKSVEQPAEAVVDLKLEDSKRLEQEINASKGEAQLTNKLLLAQNLQSRGMLAESEAAYREVIAESPDNIDAHLGLSDVSISRKDAVQATEHLKNAIKLMKEQTKSGYHKRVSEFEKRLQRIEEKGVEHASDEEY